MHREPIGRRERGGRRRRDRARRGPGQRRRASRRAAYTARRRTASTPDGRGRQAARRRALLGRELQFEIYSNPLRRRARIGMTAPRDSESPRAVATYRDRVYGSYVSTVKGRIPEERLRAAFEEHARYFDHLFSGVAP